MVPGRDVVWLQVPFSSLPGEQKNVDTTLPNGANYGFPVNTMRIAANKQWAEANPAAAKLFAIMKLPIADINAQNLRMHEGRFGSRHPEPRQRLDQGAPGHLRRLGENRRRSGEAVTVQGRRQCRAPTPPYRCR